MREQARALFSCRCRRFGDQQAGGDGWCCRGRPRPGLVPCGDSGGERGALGKMWPEERCGGVSISSGWIVACLVRRLAHGTRDSDGMDSIQARDWDC